MVTAPAQARTAACGAAESGATVTPADTNQSALQPATDTLAATDHRHRCPANELRRHYWDKPFLGRSAAAKYWPLPPAAVAVTTRPSPRRRMTGSRVQGGCTGRLRILTVPQSRSLLRDSPGPDSPLVARWSSFGP